MRISTQYFKYSKEYKLFSCNIETITSTYKGWSPFTHPLVLVNPKTNNIRQFVFEGNYPDSYMYSCGDLRLKMYKYKKDSKIINVRRPSENLFVADKGGIVNNFMEDYIQEIENAEQYYLI